MKCRVETCSTNTSGTYNATKLGTSLYGALPIVLLLGTKVGTRIIAIFQQLVCPAYRMQLNYFASLAIMTPGPRACIMHDAKDKKFVYLNESIR